MSTGSCRSQKREVRSPRVEVTGVCEPPDLGADKLGSPKRVSQPVMVAHAFSPSIQDPDIFGNGNKIESSN